MFHVASAGNLEESDFLKVVGDVADSFLKPLSVYWNIPCFSFTVVAEEGVADDLDCMT